MTTDKLAPDVLPVLVSGYARDGETIALPNHWAFPPLVAMTVFSLPSTLKEELEEGPVCVGVVGLREDGGEGTGQWVFDAVGDFKWIAIGYVRRDE